MDDDCPCGSGNTYVACCGRFHNGAAIAPTALELMRSRYSAFVVHDVDYLMATWHPATRPASLDLEPAIEWRLLQILGSSDGNDDDDSGTVEFVAHYWDSVGRLYGRQHENSSFVREEGHWFYVEPLHG